MKKKIIKIVKTTKKQKRNVIILSIIFILLLTLTLVSALGENHTPPTLWNFSSGNVYVDNITIEEEAIIQSGNSFSLSFMTMENEGTFTSIDTDFGIHEDEEPTAFLGLYCHNGSAFTHCNFIMEAGTEDYSSVFNIVKNSPLHPYSANSSGIINEGNHGTFVEEGSQVSWWTFSDFIKDEYGNIQWLNLSKNMMILDTTGLWVNGSLNVTGTYYGINNQIDERTITQAVTGVLYGGRVSINPTNTSEIIITDGEGQVVDFSNPASATISRFPWDNMTTGIKCVPSTDCWILLNGSGNIIQQSNPSTPLQKRTHIDIARAWTANATTTVILGVRDSRTFAFNGAMLAADIGYTIGAVSIWGNGISANTENSSNLDKTEGEIFRMNYGAGTTPESPHIINSPAQSPIVANWYNFYGNLSNTSMFTVDYSDVGMNCDYYSVNGVKTPVPNNQYQIIDFYWWAFSEAPGPTFGTETYNTLAAAISNRETENKAINRGYMTGAMVIGSIACKEGEDWSEATFLPPMIGGGGGAGGTPYHSGLSGLEYNVQGNKFENGGTMDIGNYNFIVNRTTFYVNTSIARIGMGTTSPVWPLHLYRTDEHSVLQIEANGSNHGEANLWLKTQSDSLGWQIFMDDSTLNDLGEADRLGFYHYGNPTSSMVIDGNSGNVGIGTINPLSTLHVNGSGAVISGDFNSYGSLTESSFVVDIDGSVGGTVLGSHNGTSRQKMEFQGSEYEFETGTSPGNYNYFVINPSGNVGIGTTTPTERLTIDVDENNFGGLEVTNSYTGTNAQSSLILRTVNSTTAFGQDGTYGWLLTARKSNFATTDLQEDLLLSYRDGTSWNNIMFIEHDTGNVGIGTTSPTQKLDVNGAINATRVYTSKIGNSGGILKLNPDATGIVELFGDADVLDDENGKMFYVLRRAPEGDDYIRFYIDSDRKAFIQSDNELTLQAHTDDIIFKVGDNAGAKNFYFKDSDGISVADIDSNGNAWFDGNVGIGTTTPDWPLHLFRTDENSVLQIEANGSSHGEANLFFNTSSDPGWQIFMDDISLDNLGEADRLGFYYYGEDYGTKMVIDGSSGNVGIGTTSPLTTLHVNGNAYMDGDLNISGTYYGDGSQLTGTGWSGYEIISATTGSSSENKAQSAWCSAGKNVTGGGCSISGSNTNLAIQDSYPRSNGEWRCRGVETDVVAESWSMTVYAICGNI